MPSQSECEAISAILSGLQHPAIIVELGACQGEDEGWMLAVLKHAREYHVMVEPDADNFRALLNLPADPTRKVYQAAITSVDKIVTFHPNSNNSRMSGSIRQPTGHLVHHAWVKFDEKPYEVTGITLDKLCRMERLPRIDLLYVDIQGAERDMILGGERSLAITDHIFMEVETTEMYAGQALRDELVGMLEARNFTLVADFGGNVLMAKRK